MTRCGSNASRSGFTLLEILIVLGVIVVLLGFGMPSLQRMHVRSQLRGTAQELQSELYRTRLEAMKTGKARVFRYRVGSSVYEILPKEIFDQRENAKTGLGAVAVGSELLDGEPSTPPPVTPLPDYGGLDEKTLSNRVLFVGTATTSAEAWSVPILFYPNGRTSQATLVLQTAGREAFRQQLTLRGLTGTAQLTE